MNTHVAINRVKRRGHQNEVLNNNGVRRAYDGKEPDIILHLATDPEGDRCVG
jgi:hypothetical protein